jgi:hypothetical protein
MKVRPPGELKGLWILSRGHLVVAREVIDRDWRVAARGGRRVRNRSNDAGSHVETQGIGFLAVVGGYRLSFRMARSPRAIGVGGIEASTAIIPTVSLGVSVASEEASFACGRLSGRLFVLIYLGHNR